MKVALLSDLHLEFGSKMPEPPDVDVILLAGDITTGIDEHDNVVQELQAKTDAKVLSVHGNHEYYGHSYVMQDTYLEILDDGVSVVYNTLWAFPKEEHYSFLNDFHKIEGMSVATMRSEHLRHQSEFLELIDLEINAGRRVVCMSHHLPSLVCIKPRWKDSYGNECYASPTLEKLWSTKWEGRLVAWVYGHTHDKADFVEPNTGVRLVCNPHGYHGHQTWEPAQWKIFEV